MSAGAPSISTSEKPSNMPNSRFAIGDLRRALRRVCIERRPSKSAQNGRIAAMKTTIDAAGRVVIPKKLREKAGLTPRTKRDVRLDRGVIEIEPDLVEV